MIVGSDPGSVAPSLVWSPNTFQHNNAAYISKEESAKRGEGQGWVDGPSHIWCDPWRPYYNILDDKTITFYLETINAKI